MNYCKDCKHFRRSHIDTEYSKCSAKKEPLDGKPKHFCQTARQFSDLCGTEGKWFEASQKKWWMFWK